MQDAFDGEEISPIPTEEVFEQSEYRRKQEWATKLPGIVGVEITKGESQKSAKI